MKSSPNPGLPNGLGPYSECSNSETALRKGRAVRTAPEEGSAGLCGGWRAGRAPTTEAGLPPPDVHASPGTGCGVVGHGAAKAVSAVGAGADVVAAVLHVGQRAHGAVAGLELGGRQQGACLVCKPGCGGRKRREVSVGALPLPSVPHPYQRCPAPTLGAPPPEGQEPPHPTHPRPAAPKSPPLAPPWAGFLAKQPPLPLEITVIFLMQPINFPNYVWLKYITNCISRAHAH